MANYVSNPIEIYGMRNVRENIIEVFGKHVMELPVKLFMKGLLPPLHSSIIIEDVIKKLKRGRHPEIVRGRWRRFKGEPSKSGKAENDTFQPLVYIAQAAARAAEVEDLPQFDFVQNSDWACEDSRRRSKTRPDAYFVLRGKSGGTASWKDIGACIEYSKHKSNNCRDLGTPGFIAEEVAAHRYTHGGGRLGESTEKPTPVSVINAIFRYNPLHDLESIWWVAYYYIYRRIVVSVDGTPVLADDESQMEWPCEASHCARRTFYDRSVRSHMLSQYLPIADLYCCLHKSVLGIAEVLQKLKRRLVEVYFEAEEDWRTIDHAVGEKHDLTNTFTAVFEMIAIKQPRGIMIGRFGALTEAKQADNAVHEDEKSATSSGTHSTDQESRAISAPRKPHPYIKPAFTPHNTPTLLRVYHTGGTMSSGAITLEGAFAVYLLSLYLTQWFSYDRQRYARCLRLMDAAHSAHHNKLCEDAVQAFRDAISSLSADYETPCSESDEPQTIRNAYAGLNMDKIITLMGCYNGLASCMKELHRFEQGLYALQEVEELYAIAQRSCRPALHEWDLESSIPQLMRIDLQYQRLKGLVGMSDAFLVLGNTGSASQRGLFASAIIISLPAQLCTSDLQSLMPAEKVRQLGSFRHPDPDLHVKHQLSSEALQVRGSWQKVSMRKGTGRLYMAGGQHITNDIVPENCRDFWCLDLNDGDGWRRLPNIPPRNLKNQGWKMGVHNKKAYLFTGSPAVDVFDLVTERWIRLLTMFVGPDDGWQPWQWSGEVLPGYAMEVGAIFSRQLDLSTGEWETLSGSSDRAPADYDGPGPRQHVASWVNAEKSRIYFMQGIADLLVDSPFGTKQACSYDDLWSWDIDERKWRRERLSGNKPCARGEMSCTYVRVPIDQYFSFSYFADTFVLEHNSPKPRWRHVLTRGFPTYRAMGALRTDPDTGRMYLFGGYTNTSLVPDTKHINARGFFEEVDVVEEQRTARLGPWQKCFTCGSVGPWKKCGGACNGRAFFCDSQCLKDGWAEHKQIHACRK
ncbi:hypothetical protein POSPLADRAFT_1033940 [Postia placenta MAD-698-R-SB12]|uniref:Uncharacterized protein n=1 Tax=Postia placenta MAD-698-R-SB12 TaxID=670580 RepID=A0A1X6N119_9APHY|nr:hypothetical protein POSPLADRAFT_1033940 [Postia placenta MAD-698-R-SB12]OSX62307.1 hypothetical protein POSPLADRAFT_1033940 [Postia placenta MAD-698-R-SB12]